MIYKITIIGYLLYIQFSPSMGNIWIRNNHFVPQNAINLILQPLKDIKMWTFPAMWPINFYIWIAIATAVKYSDLWYSYLISVFS